MYAVEARYNDFLEVFTCRNRVTNRSRQMCRSVGDWDTADVVDRNVANHIYPVSAAFLSESEKNAFKYHLYGFFSTYLLLIF